MPLHNYKELKVWQKAMDVVVEVYKISATLPLDEKFGIVSQLRRSAISIPSNIAEGAARGSDKEFKRFLEISLGSANELNTQVLLCVRLNLITEESITNLLAQLNEISNMLVILIKKFSF